MNRVGRETRPATREPPARDPTTHERTNAVPHTQTDATTDPIAAAADAIDLWLFFEADERAAFAREQREQAARVAARVARRHAIRRTSR